MSEVRAPEKINDAETQCVLRQGTPCCNGDTGILAKYRSVVILCWD